MCVSLVKIQCTGLLVRGSADLKKKSNIWFVACHCGRGLKFRTELLLFIYLFIYLQHSLRGQLTIRSEENVSVDGITVEMKYKTTKLVSEYGGGLNFKVVYK